MPANLNTSLLHFEFLLRSWNGFRRKSQARKTVRGSLHSLVLRGGNLNFLRILVRDSQNNDSVRIQLNRTFTARAADKLDRDGRA